LKTYVVDASVAARFLLVEEFDEEAKAVLEGFLEGRHDLLAPPVVVYEVGNALRTAVARGEVNAGEAREAFGFFLGLNLGRMVASSDLLGKAFAFSLERGVSYYDGVYIWSSKSIDATLLTADDVQIETAKGVVSAIHLKDFKSD